MELNSQEILREDQKQGIDTDGLLNAGAQRSFSLPELQIQLDQATAILETGLARNDLAEFYTFFRSSNLPFVALFYAADARTLAHICCKILHNFGAISPAVALSIQNHLFVTGALMSFPLQDEQFELRRESLFRLLSEQRLLVANTNSQVHSEKLDTFGVIARREGEGFRIRGSAAFMSLATQADLIVFLTLLEGGDPAFFFHIASEQPSDRNRSLPLPTGHAGF